LRGLVGFGIGGAPQSVTLYAEFLPSKHRARCVVLTNMFWSIGAALEVVLAVVVMPDLGWRWLLGLSSLPLLIFAVFCSWLPESARFHLSCGQRVEAMETLKRISIENKTSLPEGKLKIVATEQRRGSFMDLLAPQHLRTTLILWFIWFANAFSYYGIVLLTTEMFQIGNACKANEANKQNLEPFCYLKCLQAQDYIDLLLTTISEFPGLFITMFIIEFIGRKKTMAVEFIIFGICSFMLNICVSRKILIVILFIARCFISGAFQAAYVYTPEVTFFFQTFFDFLL
jgi:MFS family permease